MAAKHEKADRQDEENDDSNNRCHALPPSG